MRRSGFPALVLVLSVALLASPAASVPTPPASGSAATTAESAGAPVLEAPAAEKRKQRSKGAKGKQGKGDKKRNRKKRNRDKQRDRWVPPDGAVLSNPTLGDSRVILNRILRTVRATRKGEFVRIATWNFADREAVDALLQAKRRGVRVQVITAGSTESRPFQRLRRALDRNRKDKSWAMQCKGACRSPGYSMHMKFALFSRVNRKRHVSMVGSWNLTKAAGQRQWNDLVTQSDRRLWKTLRTAFSEMRRDRSRPPHPTIHQLGRYQLQLWPVYRKNTIAKHLRKVRCWSGGRRTVVRIAIAGWFDSFGRQIADVVRKKWDDGCDVKILTTLTGRSVRRVLKAPGGRGPVPIRTLALCCSDYEEGVPSKYLHMKAVAISGAFGSQKNTKVLLTGSPNWSDAGSRADELVLRIREADRLVPKYIRRIDEWYDGGIAYRGHRFEPDPALRHRRDLPSWFELD